MLARLTQLKKLQLEYFKRPVPYEHMAALTSLSLIRGTRISRAAVLPELRHLELIEYNGSGKAISALSVFTQLTHLTLRGCDPFTAPLQLAAQLSQLERLDLDRECEQEVPEALRRITRFYE
jgi:hypothetical protein